jgi:hypothetical protein
LNQSLTVTIKGANLGGATTLSFGPGATVNSFAVDSPTQITAEITIDADATTGVRDVTVITPEGSCTLAAAFTIQQAPSGPLSPWVYVGIALGLIFLGLVIYMTWQRRARH